MEEKTDLREKKAMELVPFVERGKGHNFFVPSQTQREKGVIAYEIRITKNGLKCSCPDCVYRHVECKHILAVKQRFNL